MEWVSVKDRLPESGKPVLIYCKLKNMAGKLVGGYMCEGFYAERFKEVDCWNEGVSEYSEENDEYYLLKGWYENVHNWDDYSCISIIEGFVTHWMPLPPFPHEIDDSVFLMTNKED